MPKSTSWKRLEFFTLIAITTLISSANSQRVNAAEISPSEKSIPERLEKVRQQVKNLQRLSEKSTLKDDSDTSTETEQDREYISQWPNPNWPNWQDWQNWQNWPNWPNY